MFQFSLSAFLYGLPVGFLFCIALGPIFFLLIKSSLEYGFRYSLFIIIGVVLADATLLAIAYGGIQAYLPTGNIDVTYWTQMFGGILLTVMGVRSIIKNPAPAKKISIENSTLMLKNLTKGFLINIVNPANFMEWVGTAGLLKSKYRFEVFENFSFFTGALLAVFFTEVGIAYFAGRLRQFLNPRVVRIINTITGIVFLGFALWMFFEAWRSIKTS